MHNIEIQSKAIYGLSIVAGFLALLDATGTTSQLLGIVLPCVAAPLVGQTFWAGRDRSRMDSRPFAIAVLLIYIGLAMYNLFFATAA